MNGKVILADGTPLAKQSSKELPKAPALLIAGAKPETVATAALDDALGPGIAIKRATPHFAIWNPNPGSQRGQTIESIKLDDGIECTYFPAIQAVRVTRKVGEGDEVWVPFDGFKFLIAGDSK